MRAFVLHLILTAWLAPTIGCALFFLLTPLLQIHEPVFRLDGVIFSIFITPWISWWIFVPVACCSYLFFRFTAVRHPKGLIFWEVAWCIAGLVSAIVFLLAIGAQLGPRNNGLAAGPTAIFNWSHVSGTELLVLVGIITGVILAPIHRWFWIRLHEEHYPGATPPVTLRP